MAGKGPGTVLGRIGHAVGYAGWLVKEIFAAGVGATVAAFSPDAGMKPIIIFYPLRIRSDWERFWFSTSITATPGTLSIGFRHDPDHAERKILLVQAVFGADPIEQIEGLRQMEEHLAPWVASLPFDATAVPWRAYRDLGPDTPPEDLPSAERLD
ncbi:putative monovalent cation/H+ antiporter subunit E [Corynebacterium capitovis DSM 44611]|uniref:monovalent cation/H+ antiporter subunit E n=1 Tax=Corynebacterium capitovis TaxID=131081 RepID=UPI00037DE805|nr:monovalent cation/H+ antiporter subunit E [Corynebacterium capitovis]WKD56704.1 putative monovalent cation/H+ antiporter subunit E [Corynebacterium capitovis DSM 44611]